MCATQFACSFECIEVGAGGDGGDPECASKIRYLYGCGMLEHIEDGCAAFLGKGMGGCAHDGLRLFGRNVQILFCFIFVLRKKKHIVCLPFAQMERVAQGIVALKQAVPRGKGTFGIYVCF